MTCSRFSLLKTWLMTTEANFPLQQLCLKPSLYGRFSLDLLWPLLGDHQGPVQVLGFASIGPLTPLCRLLSLIRFLFVRPALCLQLPPDSTLRWTPLPFS
jgi:hypothetical protein